MKLVQCRDRIERAEARAAAEAATTWRQLLNAVLARMRVQRDHATPAWERPNYHASPQSKKAARASKPQVENLNAADVIDLSQGMTWGLLNHRGVKMGVLRVLTHPQQGGESSTLQARDPRKLQTVRKRAPRARRDLLQSAGSVLKTQMVEFRILERVMQGWMDRMEVLQAMLRMDSRLTTWV